jgi:hypothetical protein
MRKQIVIIALVIFLFSLTQIYMPKTEANQANPVNLNLIPCAETLGKGGFSFSTGMYPYSIKETTVDPINIDIGGFFKEPHKVELNSDIWLIPVRITYVISDRLDFTFGGTYSTGNTEKTILDYYEVGDESKKRVYSQPVLDGVLGMKYKIQDVKGNIPALAFGVELQMGYTVDDGFVDETLENGFPFVASLLYMSGSYSLNVASIHGGIGMSISSKSVQTNRRFDLPIQIGAEVPFGVLSAVVDYNGFKSLSGVGLKSVISGGLRYDISQNSALNASVASVGGFTITLTIGGKHLEAPAPTQSAPSLF